MSFDHVMETACAWTITLLYIYLYVWGLDFRFNNINYSYWYYSSPIIIIVKIKEVGLGLFYFSFSFLFYFPFSIFRTTRVRIDQSHCHSNHLMAKSQDKSRDLGEFSRRFKNRWCHTTWTPHVGLMNYTWLFRVGCTVVSTDHL